MFSMTKKREKEDIFRQKQTCKRPPWQDACESSERSADHHASAEGRMEIIQIDFFLPGSPEPVREDQQALWNKDGRSLRPCDLKLHELE